jgi:hypothetical protein
MPMTTDTLSDRKFRVNLKPKIFLDLDATLIRSYHDAELQHYPHLRDLCLNVRPGLYTVPRPGLISFVSALKVKADIFLFTAAHLDYAQSVLETCGVISHFQGLHSSGKENPGSVAQQRDLDNCPWLLVDDTSVHHHLARYKLSCLGVKVDVERPRESTQNCFLLVEGFHPHDQKYEDNMDIILKQVWMKSFGR